MKMKPEHYRHLERVIAEVLEAHPGAVDEYERGRFSRSEACTDLQQRFCFDLLHAARIGSWMNAELYPYLNDAHIYTALKAICPKIERKY